MAPFVVLGTPRTRTAWLAQFLSAAGYICLHEPSRHMRGLGDLWELLRRDGVGVSDSLLTLRWREIAATVPGVRILVVQRSVREVLDSFQRAGLWHHRLPAAVERIASEVDAMRTASCAEHIPFEALGSAAGAGAAFQHCLGKPMPLAHYQRWRGQIVLADAPKHIADAAANVAGMQAMFPELADAA